MKSDSCQSKAERLGPQNSPESSKWDNTFSHSQGAQLAPWSCFPSPGLEPCTFWSLEKENSLTMSLRPWINEVLHPPKIVCSWVWSPTLSHLSWYSSLEPSCCHKSASATLSSTIFPGLLPSAPFQNLKKEPSFPHLSQGWIPGTNVGKMV